jgi:hypothetical protein
MSPGSLVVAGIDEAGLGPLLGPLTLGYSVLRVPAGTGNVWEALDGVVARAPARDEDRIVVADSKKVHARNPRGRRRLETTVLTLLAQRPDGAPRSGADLLRTPAEPLRPRAAEVARHPWYAELPARLPLWCDAGRTELRAEALRRALERTGIEVPDAGVRVVPAGELNRSFDRTGNKSATVWELVGGVLDHLWERFGGEGAHVLVDRQGGRFRYGRLLQQRFPGARVRVAVESPDHSEYHIESADPSAPERSMRLTFAERAEDRAFSVAVASCLAKYARELSMEAFNAHFEALQPGLTPTAGYTTDGRRWVREAAPALERAGIDPEVLLRRR